MVSVLVCDESAVERRQLMVALEASPDIEVIAEADDAETLVAQVQETAPDVVWLDLRLAGVGGRAADRLDPRGGAHRPGGGRGRRRRREARRRAIKAGAVGVVDRERPGPGGRGHPAGGMGSLRARVRPISTACWRPTRAFARQAGSVQQQVAPPALDARQQQVLELLAADRPPAEVASELGLALATVENLVADAVAALHRHTRAEAITFAVDAPDVSADGGGLSRRRSPGRLVALMGVFDKVLRAGEGKKVRAVQSARPRDQRARATRPRPCPTTHCGPARASSASASTTARPSTTCSSRRSPSSARPPSGSSASATTTSS